MSLAIKKRKLKLPPPRAASSPASPRGGAKRPKKVLTIQGSIDAIELEITRSKTHATFISNRLENVT